MKGCYGKKQNIHDFLLLYQFLYVLLRTFLIHRFTMKKSLFFIMAFIFACSLCVTNSSCNDKKMDGADSLASDSTLVDTTAADSTDEIIAETPMPKAADELFDDFIFNFAANKKLQMKRICFPLPVYKNGKLTKEIEKGKWKMEHFFMRQGYYTLIFDNKAQIKLVKDTTISHVVVEKIFFKIKTVQQFVFDRKNGEWMLTAIEYKPIFRNMNASFLKFYEKFSRDSLFQINSMAEEVKFTTPDPDDDFSSITGNMMPEQWPDFKPELIPTGTLYNIIYGQKYSESTRKVFMVRGIANGLEIEMVFRRRSGKWLLTEFSC